MKRLFLTLAVIATSLGPMSAGDLAVARDGAQRWDVQDRRGNGRGRAERAPQGRRWQDADRAGRRSDNPGRGRGQERRRDYGPPPGDYAPRYDVPRGPSLRSGGYMPDGVRGAMIRDFGRYRLRPPPSGFAWYMVGNDFLLVSLIDGQIFDIIVN